MTLEVVVEGWTLAILGGSWLDPDGDGYEPDEAGEIWVKSPDGQTATIAWSRRAVARFDRLLGPRTQSDFGVFEAWTLGTGPTTRANSARFLAELLPDLRHAAAALK